MPEWHNIYRENEIPSAGSAFASSELPAVEFIFPGSGDLRGKTCRSAPCLRTILATLASMAAVVLLVFLCFRTYKTRAAKDLRNRRLASSEDSDAPIDVCGNSSDEEEEPEQQRENIPVLPAEEEWRLPLKKRLLVRVGETGTGVDGRSPEQQERQQKEDEAGAPALTLSPSQPTSSPERLDSPLFPAPSLLPAAEMRTPAQLDTATGSQNFLPRKRRPPYRAPRSRKGATLSVRLRLRDVIQERWHQQQQQRYFQQQQDNWEAFQQQQQQQFLYWQGTYWHQQEQQHYLLPHQAQPYLMQQGEQQESLQRLAPAAAPDRVLTSAQVSQGQEQQQTVQQHEQQQLLQPQAEGEQWLVQAKGMQQAELDLWEGAQPLLQTTYSLSGVSPEDAWIDQESASAEVPHPSTSQQALQPYAFPAVAGPSTAFHSTMQWLPGSSQAGSDLSPGSAAVGTSTNGIAAASTSTVWPGAFPSVDASTAPRGSISTEMPLLAGLLSRREKKRTRREASKTGATASKTATTAAAASARPRVPEKSTTARAAARSDFTPASNLHHPFVRLPVPFAPAASHGFTVDMKKAVESQYCMKNPLPLLRESNELLSREILYPADLKRLAQVAGLLISHAMHHQTKDVSLHRARDAIVPLGVRFLLLDSVVSAFLVLGQTPERKYWNVFASAVSHACPPMVERIGMAGRPEVSSSRVQELSVAIQILKTGIRPSPRCLLETKRMLFCFSNSPRYFRRPAFDSWRKDNSKRSAGP